MSFPGLQLYNCPALININNITAMVNYFQKLYDQEQLNLSEEQASLPPVLAVLENTQKNGMIVWAKKNLERVVSVLVLIYLVLLIANLLTCKDSYMTFQVEDTQNGDAFSSDLNKENNIITAGQDDAAKMEKESRSAASKDAEVLISKDSEPKKDVEEKTQKAIRIKSGKQNQLTEQELSPQIKSHEAKEVSQSEKMKEATSLIPSNIKELAEEGKKQKIDKTDITSPLFEDIRAIKDREYNKRKSEHIQEIYSNLDYPFRKSIHAPALAERQNIVNQYKGKDERSLLLLAENQELNPVRTELDEQYLDQIKSQYGLKDVAEVNMCVVLSTHNNIFNGQIQRTLNSIYNQQYKQYQVIINDLSSNDGTYASIEKYIEQNQLSKKTTLLQYDSESQVHALWNSYKYCKQGSIILYMDGNTELLGKEVLSLYNFMYATTKANIAYSNEFHLDASSQKLKLFSAEKYDESEVFMLLYRKLASKFGRLFSFKAETMKRVTEDYVKFNGKHFQYTGIGSLAVSLLEVSCGHVQKIDLPLSLAIKDSQIEKEEQKERNHEQHLISDKLKLDKC